MLIFLLSMTALGQDLLVHPYLQDATPTSVWVHWETDGGEESVAEWGTDPSLGTESEGTTTPSVGAARLHAVQLSGLTPDTAYHYRVRTGAALSTTWSFRTPSDDPEASVRFLAMSDMQSDWLHPDKFREVVDEGVLTFLMDDLGLDAATALAFTVIPGDLVDNGLVIDEWRETFFGPADDLLAVVPTYPVPGNHENDSSYFFEYFRLPDNGAVPEHSWWFDRANVRIVGLDSNAGYRTPEQLAWLETTLADACSNPDIDFLFGQLHHPHESELWLAGELSYTGDVIALLETFSTDCGKPSALFNGHTHGYSRGQSRDHTHLMVDVATAGGNVDYWGEYAQRDYEAYTVTQSEYGFVLVEVTAGDDPHFELRRVSRGNTDLFRDNEVRDPITVRRYPVAPDTPTLDDALDGAAPECILLEASDYAHPDGTPLGAAQWQVATDCSFETPAVDRWRQHENWYRNVDTQASDDLGDELVAGLLPETDYCARVRYRDQGLTWSDWSDPVPFTTGTTGLSEDLIVNGGAEDGTTGWTAVTGYLESLTAGECEGTSPYEGSRYFAVGGLCEEAPVGIATQRVDMTDWTDEIDAGGAAWLQAWLANWGGDDEPSIHLVFLSKSDVELGRGTPMSNRTATWTPMAAVDPIPVGTRTIEVVLTGTRHAGVDNDSYIDGIALQVGPLPDRLCLPPTGDTGDTGDTSDTAETSDTGVTTTSTPPTDTDTTTGETTPTPDETTPDTPLGSKTSDSGGTLTDEGREGCGCSGPGGPSLWWLALLPLLRRHQRRGRACSAQRRAQGRSSAARAAPS